MNEVPADVIEAGNRFADLFGDGRQGYTAFDIAVLAVMAERERCVKIAEALDSGELGDRCIEVAAAIRKGEPV